MSDERISWVIEAANRAINTGNGINLARRKVAALLDSKFALPLDTETVLISLLAALTVAG